MNLWHHPDFRKFWAGRTISLFGSEITMLALPLTAILTLDATPAQLGILTAAADPTVTPGQPTRRCLG